MQPTLGSSAGSGKTLKVLYLFCGVPRKADVKQCLKKLAVKHQFELEIREVDIERSSDDDLTKSQLWDELLEQIRSGQFDVVFMSPPCNTWSRVRYQWQKFPGPRPVRSAVWPMGFPWLSNKQKELVEFANYFVKQTIQACYVASTSKTKFLVEHPEDLGAVGKERPASVWQLEEMRQMVLDTGATTWAVFQCQYGGLTPKPTRFVSDIQEAKKVKFNKWPSFSKEGQYLGPLPYSCGHRWHVKKLIGKSKDGRFQTGPSAAYPPGLCMFLAQLIASVLRSGGGELQIGQVSKPVGRVSEVDFQQEPCVDTHKEDTVMEKVEHSFPPTPPPLGMEKVEHSFPPTPPPLGERVSPSQENAGQPMWVEWAGRETEFVDGFGLCSPNLFRPEQRGAFLGSEAKALARNIHSLVVQFVSNEIGDVRDKAFRLAVGQFSASPFSQGAMEELRRCWARLLPRPQSAVEIPEGQPFLLELMSQTLEIFGDPDWMILTTDKESFATGVPVGYGKPLPRVPSVFPERVKQSKLDESEYMAVAKNYKSAEENSKGLEEKFREDESAGLMFPTTMGVLQSMYPSQEILVAALGAIKKPDGSVRPLHDGTHFVQVNNNIVINDQLQYPGPQDTAGVIREVHDSKEAVFTISADISAAHRRVKIRREDWRLLACRSDASSKVIWVNKVGTFGISSAPLWWTRLFSLVGRLVMRVLGQENLFQIVYVDDLHGAFLGDRKFLNLWVTLALYEALGTPFAYKKFSGGIDAQFVGYKLDYKMVSLGVNERRGAWLLEFLASLKKDKFTVHMRRFAEFLGRLGFVSRVLCWMKPHLAPLYTWSAALDKGTVATMPKLVRLVCMYIEQQLMAKTFMYSCKRPHVIEGDLFRTDAKCETGKVTFGGYHLGDGRWFSLSVSPSEAPYLFKANGDSQWASAPSELLAVMIALQVYGFLEDSAERKQFDLVVQGGTDNRSIEQMTRKAATTRWPLVLVNMQLTDSTMRSGMRVSLKWRPRDENTVADDLTNEKFDQVDSAKRVHISWNEIKLDLLNKLWGAREEFLDRDSWIFFDGVEKSAPFEKTSWG